MSWFQVRDTVSDHARTVIHRLECANGSTVMEHLVQCSDHCYRHLPESLPLATLQGPPPYPSQDQPPLLDAPQWIS